MRAVELIGLSLLAIYLLALGLESRFAARTFTRVCHWNRTGIVFFLLTLAVGMGTQLLLPIARTRVRPVLDLGGLGIISIPLGIIAVSVATYWFHRAEHHYNWLWRVAHQLHHSAKRIDISAAYLSHPVEVILKTAIIATVSLWLLGLSTMATAMVWSAASLLTMWQHLNIRTPHWIGYFVPRPEAHVMHHECGPSTKNFGDIPLWDIVFGTFANPRAHSLRTVGLDVDVGGRMLDMLMMKDIRGCLHNARSELLIDGLTITQRRSLLGRCLAAYCRSRCRPSC